MARKKTFRRFIKYAGKLHASPEFSRKADADAWYMEMRRQKAFRSKGLNLPDSGNDGGISVIDYARDFMDKREKVYRYPRSTTAMDEQRFRDYILPLIGELPLKSITSTQVKSLLIKISEPGFKMEGRSISKKTRDRVKALLSAMFKEALNEDPPLVLFNPVSGIRLNEPRTGTADPKHIESDEKIREFLETAKRMGKDEFEICATFVMSGLRKQEIIALRWTSFQPLSQTLTVREKYIQATGEIVSGTKAGSEQGRVFPISQALVRILEGRWRRLNPNELDLIFPRRDGKPMSPRTVWALIKRVGAEAGLKVSPHALRHTFGRVFVQNTGNPKALQSILGHASSATTDIYSKLGGNRLMPFSEAVSFGQSVKRKNKRHTKTQKKASK